jgi:hypothetical protein
MKVFLAFSAIAVSTMTVVPMAALGAEPSPSCVCSFKPTTPLTSEGVNSQAFVDRTSFLDQDQVVLSDFRSLIAEGPPSDEKGTPGNRGGCGAYQCGNSQSRAPEGQTTPRRDRN